MPRTSARPAAATVLALLGLLGGCGEASDDDASSDTDRARVLRAKGFALIELARLDEAEAAPAHVLGERHSEQPGGCELPPFVVRDVVVAADAVARAGALALAWAATAASVCRTTWMSRLAVCRKARRAALTRSASVRILRTRSTMPAGCPTTVRRWALTRRASGQRKVSRGPGRM